MITMSSFNASLVKLVTRNIADRDDTSKKGIVVTARVHPGETNSSWMMKGLLDFITGPSNAAKVKSLEVLSSRSWLHSLKPL